jgi:hypothetical protein
MQINKVASATIESFVMNEERCSQNIIYDDVVEIMQIY